MVAVAVAPLSSLLGFERTKLSDWLNLELREGLADMGFCWEFGQRSGCVVLPFAFLPRLPGLSDGGDIRSRDIVPACVGGCH